MTQPNDERPSDALSVATDYVSRYLRNKIVFDEKTLADLLDAFGHRRAEQAEKELERASGVIHQIVAQDRAALFEGCIDCEHEDQCSRESGCATVALSGGSAIEKLARTLHPRPAPSEVNNV